MKHGPNRLASYQEIHETVMQRRLSGGFVVEDGVLFVPLQGSIMVEGLIRCIGDIRITVAKRLQVISGDGANATVQTVYYSYNVALAHRGTIFRYDSPHAGHNQFHHVHRYDVLNGDTTGTVHMVPDDEWPHLSEVISEAEEWYYSNLAALGE